MSNNFSYCSGNLLSEGMNTYAYNYANRLVEVSGQETLVSYRYNGLGDRLQQTVDEVTTDYTLDLAAGLTKVLGDETFTYLYGNGRIAQYVLLVHSILLNFQSHLLSRQSTLPINTYPLPHHRRVIPLWLVKGQD